MDEKHKKYCTAFKGHDCIASGIIVEVAKKVKEIIDSGEVSPVLIFDDFTSKIIEIDFRGTKEDVLERLERLTHNTESSTSTQNAEQNPQRGPGRPKLGVVSREVTLLPRHWDWLNSQPGGASVALRKLVEEARGANAGRDKIRHSQEAAYRFMSAMAGNLLGFEETTRALFSGDSNRFNELIVSWPIDIRNYAKKLADAAFHN